MRIVLSVGPGTRYCSECGGIEKGNPARVFVRKECAAPAACGPCGASGAFLGGQSLC